MHARVQFCVTTTLLPVITLPYPSSAMVFGSRVFPTLSIQRGNGEPHPSLLQPLSPFFKLHRRCTQFDHGEPAAMVRSGMSVGITNNRRRRPYRTDMSSWSEVFVVRALTAFNSDVAYTKRPLFDDVRNNYTAPSPLNVLWSVSTLPLQAYSNGMII